MFCGSYLIIHINLFKLEIFLLNENFLKTKIKNRYFLRDSITNIEIPIDFEFYSSFSRLLKLMNSLYSWKLEIQLGISIRTKKGFAWRLVVAQDVKWYICGTAAKIN